MPAFTVSNLDLSLLVGALVLLVAVAAVRLSVRSGLPSLLLYVGIGVVVGEAGISFDSPELTRVLGYSALVLILAEGGLTTSWDDIRGSVAPAALLSTLGVVVSVVVVALAAHLALDVSWTVALLVVTVLAYAVGARLHASGFLATYLSALVLGNMRLPHRAAVRGFAQALGWLAQIGLFVLLGLLVTPARLATQIVPAVVIGLALLLVARPLSVIVSLTPFRMPWRDQAFLSWAGLRGGVPIVLATVPLTAGTPDARRIFDLVFVLVVIFTLVQAPTLPWVARRLAVTDSDRALDLEVESTPLDELGADVLQMTVGATSKLHGVEVFELRLPPGANVTLVVRGGKGL